MKMMHKKYNELVRDVLTNGIEVNPRGNATHEMFGPLVMEVPFGQTPKRSGLNIRLALAESLMMIGGIFDLDVIKQVAPNANIDLYRKQSDYGPRIVNQMPRLIELMAIDRLTRRSVAYFNTMRHFGTDDLACTTSIQWLIRNNSLIANVTLRSWDMVFGLPMDLVMYSLLSQTVGRCLDVEMERMFIFAGSAHVYQSTASLGVATGTLSFWLGDGWTRSSWWDDHSRSALTALNHLLARDDKFESFVGYQIERDDPRDAKI